MILRTAEFSHFDREFRDSNGLVARSRRVILALKDQCNVKVTEFEAPTGWSEPQIYYTVDETVRVISGKIRITINGTTSELEAGCVYHAKAGETYGVEVVEDVILFCVFSPSSVMWAPNFPQDD